MLNSFTTYSAIVDGFVIVNFFLRHCILQYYYWLPS